MKFFNNQNSLFIELGVFETRVITNFNSQSIIIKRFEDDHVKKIYPLDYDGRFSSYENLKFFFAYIFSLIENQSFLSRFFGLKIYVLVNVDTQVEAEAITDSINSQNVRTINLFSRKDLLSFGKVSNLTLNIDINGCDVIGTKVARSRVDRFKRVSLVNLYILAINHIKSKYLNKISYDDLYLRIYGSHKNSADVFKGNLQTEFVERFQLELEKNLFLNLQEVITSLDEGKSRLIFAGDFFQNEILYKQFKKSFKGYELKIERSPTYLLECLRNNIQNNSK